MAARLRLPGCSLVCRRSRRKRWPKPRRPRCATREQVMNRASTAEQIPAVGKSLEAGRVSGGHVDVITRALRQLAPAVRDKLIEAAPSLVESR